MLERFIWFWRKILLNFKIGVDAHWSSLVDRSTRLEGKNYISKNVHIVNSSFGCYSYVNNGSKIINANVGRYSCIGPNVYIGGLGNHPTNRLSTHRMFYSKALKLWSGFCFDENFTEVHVTNVGSDVWVGVGVIVLDGVSVGHGAIIAAGAVVTKDVAPYSIVGGVPAKHIKYRFSPEIIDELLNLKWWEKSEAELLLLAEKGIFSKEYGGGLS